MLRLSRHKNINDIEAILNSSGPALGQRKWKAKDAECRLDRHVYLGEHYSIHKNVLDVSFCRHLSSWRVLIVSEFWEDGKGQTIHSSKWLKLLEGKSTDLLKWIRTHRDSL
ncbi:MAG: hypothetical protein ACR2HL_00730 [Methylocystis sp.]